MFVFTFFNEAFGFAELKVSKLIELPNGKENFIVPPLEWDKKHEDNITPWQPIKQQMMGVLTDMGRD